jgi:hypothetical protein
VQVAPPGQLVQLAVEPHVLGEQTGGEPLAQQFEKHCEFAVQRHHHCCALVAPVLTHSPLAQWIPQAPQLLGVLIVVGVPPQQRAR